MGTVSTSSTDWMVGGASVCDWGTFGRHFWTYRMLGCRLRQATYSSHNTTAESDYAVS